MTKETLLKRIDGKEKLIVKLEKKLARIEKAAASNWENNPYYYDESDLKWCKKDLDEARQVLIEYQTELQIAIEKENSRDVKAITEFLDNWEERVISYFLDEKSKFDIEYVELKKYNKNFFEKYYDYSAWESKEEKQEAVNEHNEKWNAFRKKWLHVTQFGNNDWESRMRKEIRKEKNRKYDFIIKRTNKIVGEITDASNLHIGAKGDLNGYIVGTKGTAKVNTIDAGGYNIQCYHFRTLIKAI